MEKTIIMKLDEADVYDMYYARLEMVRKNFNWDCDEDLFDKFVDYVCSLDSVPTPKVAVDNFIVNGSIYNKDCPEDWELEYRTWDNVCAEALFHTDNLACMRIGV